jgi:ATP-binding cassette subfamily C protein
MPWVIAFMIVLSALHWWLGVDGARPRSAFMAGIAIVSRPPHAGPDGANWRTSPGAALPPHFPRSALPSSAYAMGMQERLVARTAGWETDFIEAQSYLARTVTRLGGASKAFRMLLQSLILSVGALLVIDGQAGGGVILASSVLSGRALAPVDQAIANWKGLVAARAGWPASRRPSPRSASPPHAASRWSAPRASWPCAISGWHRPGRSASRCRASPSR